MKYVSMFMAAVSTLVALSTSALATGFYLDMHGGAVFPEDSFTRIFDPELPASFGAHTNYDVGWLAGGAGGYELPMGFALEGEFTFRQNQLDRIATHVSPLFTGGDIHSYAMMANAYYRLHNPTPFTPYLGGGVGEAVVVLNNAHPVGASGNLGGDDVDFAYQGIAGVSWKLPYHLDMSAEYRYFATLRPGLEGNVAGIDSFKVCPNYRTHNALLKLTYNFE
jgi:opacity protein-like surface antigen